MRAAATTNGSEPCRGEAISVVRSGDTQESLSRGAIAGRFVTSFFESACYASERRNGGAAFRFQLNPAILADRVVAICCPQYNLLTTVVPGLSGWLTEAADKVLSASRASVSSLNYRRLTQKLLTFARDTVGLGVLACLPAASAEQFRVANAWDLKRIGRDNPRNGHYYQTRDISAPGVEIVEFSGIYEGNNHAIYNFDLPLFSKLSGIVKNVTFRDVRSSEDGDHTALVIWGRPNAELQNVVIENIRVTGHWVAIIEMERLGNHIKLTNVTVRGCHVKAKGYDAFAGIGDARGVASADNIRFENCTAHAEGERASAGILTGKYYWWPRDHPSSNVTIVNCHASANGTKSAAGILSGSVEHAAGRVRYNASSPRKYHDRTIPLVMAEHVEILGGSVSANGVDSSAALLIGSIDDDVILDLRGVRAECVNISATGSGAMAWPVYGGVLPGANIPANNTVACNLRVNGVVNDDYCPGSNTTCPAFEVPVPPTTALPVPTTVTVLPSATVEEFKKINTTQSPFRGSNSVLLLPVCALAVVAFLLAGFLGCCRAGMRGRALFYPLFRPRRSAGVGEQHAQARVHYRSAPQIVNVLLPDNLPSCQDSMAGRPVRIPSDNGASNEDQSCYEKRMAGGLLIEPFSSVSSTSDNCTPLVGGRYTPESHRSKYLAVPVREEPEDI